MASGIPGAARSTGKQAILGSAMLVRTIGKKIDFMAKGKGPGANRGFWSFVLKGGKATDFTDHPKDLQPAGGRINLIASFAEDSEANLYVVDHSGSIYRIAEL